jgi:hypothetical protein
MILFSIIRYISKKISVITRQERRRLVLELCNEGKTKHEIAKDARISFGDIGVILNKAVEEKRTEGSKEEQDNNIVGKNDQKKNAYIYPQAYKLFSNRKILLEVAVALNLRESEATKFYKEYWKLKQLHNLNIVY